MTFNSLEFVIFFPIVTLLYFWLPHRFRWGLLLGASSVFYMAFVPRYIIILFALILIDYSLAIFIEKTSGRRKKTYLVISIISTCATLFVYKYFNFFNDNLSSLASFLHWNYPLGALELILPLGLSFHTFQSLAYVIEVYRGNFKTEYNLGYYALYVMFYPQLVAGPIERPQHLLPQFRMEHHFDYDRVVGGLKRILWGMFKKVVIADNLAIVVNAVYGNPHGYTGLPLLEATIFFGLQIYFDFSGYADIALGSAKVMGFELMENFKNPYLATSISDFWRRWHISLSSWFRDYVYIPLGGNRVSNLRWGFNIAVVFLLSGLWHGANWTFLLWGGLHGIYMICSRATQGLRDRIVQGVGLDKLPRLHMVLRVAVTFSLVSFAWIFFRAKNVADAFYIVSHLFVTDWEAVLRFVGVSHYINTAVTLLYGKNFLIFLVITAIAFFAFRRSPQYGGAHHVFLSGPWLPVRWVSYSALIWTILLYGVLTGRNEFIYFAF